MFFFIFGIKDKVVAKESVKVNKNGLEVNAFVTVTKKYFELFFIPIFSISKNYTMYIPHSDEYFDDGNFNKMPEEYLKVCKNIASKY